VTANDCWTAGRRGAPDPEWRGADPRPEACTHDRQLSRLRGPRPGLITLDIQLDLLHAVMCVAGAKSSCPGAIAHRGRRRHRSCWCPSTSPERRKRRTYNEPGLAHERTLSCSRQLRAPHRHRPDVTPSPSVPAQDPVTPQPPPVNSRHDPIEPSSRTYDTTRWGRSARSHPSIDRVNPMYSIITWLRRACRHRPCVSP
jgi:hypothetical protein